jgi:signal transduction histidine kinase/ActR/RegA family two-component response regulator
MPLPPGQVQGADYTCAALQFLHGLLQRDPPPAIAELLGELASAFGACAAGLVAPQKAPLVQFREGPGSTPARWPWDEQPDLLDRLRQSPRGVAVRTADARSWLLATARSPGADWLLWLEGAQERSWASGEAAALVLAAQVLVRVAATAQEAGADWTRALERVQLQHRLEFAAHLAGRLAHDFGNVLTGILGFAELSLGQLSPDSLPHLYVKEIWQSAQQGAQWIQKLQLFGRRRGGSPPPTALAPVVALEEGRVRTAWGPDVALHVMLPEELPQAGIEPEALRHALAQLLDNAREAISGKGVVTVSARAVELCAADCHELLGDARPGAHVEITVTDTGSGLSPEARQRLFRELFFSTKVRRRGLGLAMVYGILHACRGAIRFGPDPAQGTAVRLYLPALAAPQAAARPATGAGARVLIVDDDPLVLRFMSSVLEGAGFRTRAAAGGAEALAAYAGGDEPFSLVLTDVLMPEMNGFELARRLHRQDPGVNVLFVSGEASPARADEAPPFPLLTKPFRADGLVQAVRDALGKGGPALALPEQLLSTT